MSKIQSKLSRQGT